MSAFGTKADISQLSFNVRQRVEARWRHLRPSASIAMTFNILSILAHVRWRASSEKILARRCEDVDHLGILLAPSLMLQQHRRP